MAGSALKGGGETEGRAGFSLLPWKSQELDLTGLAIAGLYCVDESCADLRRKRKTVDKDKDRSIKVEFEQAFRR